jgi:hypothetical protein
VTRPLSRPVHGSVWFDLNHKNQLNQVTHIFKNSNRTKFRFKSNRFGSVESGFVAKKPGNLIFKLMGFFDFFLMGLD